MIFFDLVRLPGTPGPKQVLPRDGNEVLAPHFWCFFDGLDILVFLFLFQLSFYRLLDALKSQIHCV